MWTIVSNNGSSLVANCIATGESFSGTPTAFAAMFTTAGKDWAINCLTTTTLPALLEDQDVLLDQAAGSTLILPDSTGSGITVTAFVSVTATSNSHIVKVSRTADKMTGFLHTHDMDANATSFYRPVIADDVNGITMNRTTTGGLIGDWVRLKDIKANTWVVTGGHITCVAGNNIANPFSKLVT